MSYLTADPSTRIRSVNTVLPAVTGASGQGNSVFVSSNDDDKQRRLTGLYSTFQTKLLKIHVRVAGKEIMVLDAQAFNAAAGFIPCDQLYGINQQFEFALESNNPGGPAVVANTDSLTFRYEVQPTA